MYLIMFLFFPMLRRLSFILQILWPCCMPVWHTYFLLHLWIKALSLQLFLQMHCFEAPWAGEFSISCVPAHASLLPPLKHNCSWLLLLTFSFGCKLNKWCTEWFASLNLASLKSIFGSECHIQWLCYHHLSMQVLLTCLLTLTEWFPCLIWLLSKSFLDLKEVSELF